MTSKVVLLYEDKAVGPAKGYGPHKLVVQCVCDALGVEPWRMWDIVEGIPRAGYANVRKDCRDDPLKLGRRGVLVVAIYDLDKIHRLAQVPASACKGAVKEKLSEGCPWPDRLKVVFIERNLETVLEAARTCAAHMAAEDQWRKAIDRKDLGARDTILAAAAAPSPSGRAVRDCMLRAVPSLAYLVQKLAEACRPLIAPST